MRGLDWIPETLTGIGVACLVALFFVAAVVFG